MSFVRSSHRRVLLWCLFACALVLTGLILMVGESAQAAPAACGSGVSGNIDVDTTWSGEVYVDDDVTVQNSTLTIEPGTQVIFCGEYRLLIGDLFDPARLLAQGTAAEPIVFTGADANTRWQHIYFGDHLDQGPSILQYATLDNGGGADPSQGQTIKVSDRATTPAYATPLLDHVTVRNSNGYGIDVEARNNDPRPAQLTDVTVENSSLAAVNVMANAIGGIGAGFSATGNAPDHIRVDGNDMNFDSHWRNHGVPYEVVNGFAIRSNYAEEDLVPAVWTIDPGVTILMHPATSITIGSLYGEAQVEAEGTPEEPVTFSRLDENSAPWNGFNIDAFSDLDSHFSYVNFEYGGGLANDRDALFVKRGGSSLVLENSSIQHSQNGAVYVFGGDVWVKNSTISNNRYGIDVRARSQARVNGSDLSNNAEFALNNSSPNYLCIDAVGNYWGPGGPQDASEAEDACNSSRSNAGSATVSDGVLYMPWQTAPDGSGEYGAIVADSFWVLGNGSESTELTVTLLDAQGAPLSGKQVELETTIGTLQQPAAATDAEGQTTAVISSTETGFATITAFNVTDNEPVAGTAGINFWQGAGDFGGLVDPNGAPYASPVFEVIGKPFQQGFPVEMRMPMQNSGASTMDVEVVYGVTGLSIGTRFTPVYTATATLQPGETWDAQGVWVPEVTGHHCIQARLSYDDGQQQLAVELSGSGTLQINTDQNPCSGLPSGPGDFAPDRPQGGSEDVKTAAKHFKDQSVNLYDAIQCINQEVNFRSPINSHQPRDYEVIATVPQFTPPAIAAGPNLTADQADALNALSQSSADLLGLGRAIATTRQRMQWAAQADSLPDLDRQYAAYLDFVGQYIDTLRELADLHDDFLAVTEGAGLEDATFYPEDYETAFADLQQNGFDAETRTYLEQSGLPDALIDELRADIVDTTDAGSFQTTSFYQVVRNTRDNALRVANRLERQYGLGSSLRPVASPTAVTPVTQEFDFTVGHQRTSTETVDLVIRPVSMPMDWSARLEQDSVSLGPGETMSNTLAVVPGGTMPEGTTVQVAVEGYVGGDYIGGILFTYNTPVVSQPREGNGIYLPIMIRQ